LKLKILLIIVLLATSASATIRQNPDGSITVMAQATGLAQCSIENTAYLMAKRATMAIAYREAAKYYKVSKIFLKSEPEFSSLEDFLKNDCVGIVATFAKSSRIKALVNVRTKILIKKEYAEISKGGCGYCLESEKSFLILSFSFKELKQLCKKSEPTIVLTYGSTNEIMPAEFGFSFLQLVLNRIDCPQSILLYFNNDLVYEIILH
jgi:hypothetical protein